MSNCSSVYDGLGKLGRVLADIGKRGGGDSLKRKLWLLNAEHKKGDCSSIDDSLKIMKNVILLEKYLCELVVVSGDVTKSPGGCFLYTGVEFFEADDESIKGATVDNLKKS